MGASGMLIGQLFGALLLFVVALVIVIRLQAWSFSASQVRAALRFGLPLLPHTFASWALRLSDRWLIGLLIGLPVLQAQAAIGVYSFGYQIGYMVSIIVISFNAAWSPYFFRVGQTARGPALFREVTTLATAGLLVLAVGLSVLSSEVVLTLAGRSYAAAIEILPVVAFASVFQGLYTLMVTVVFLMKRTGRLALLTISSAILNVALNVVLIPRIGIMGAAWSTLAGYAFFAAGTWLYGSSIYPLRLDLPRLGVIGALALAAVVVSRQLTIEDEPLLQGSLHLLIGLVYAAVVGILVLRPLASLRTLTSQPSAGVA
jgi:O-antigen/teichoic acid export membrane protein